MKKLLLALFCLSLSNQGFSWTQLANCGTGDAIAGLTVYTDGADYIVHIHSQDDQQAPTEYRTTAGDLTQDLDMIQEMRDLSNGKEKLITLAQDDSFAFGGGLSHAALMQLNVHETFSYDHNSQIASNGGVISLFCNKPRD